MRLGPIDRREFGGGTIFLIVATVAMLVIVVIVTYGILGPAPDERYHFVGVHFHKPAPRRVAHADRAGHVQHGAPAPRTPAAEPVAPPAPVAAAPTAAPERVAARTTPFPRPARPKAATPAEPPRPVAAHAALAPKTVAYVRQPHSDVPVSRAPQQPAAPSAAAPVSFVHQVMPEYPSDAFAAKITGTVIVVVSVDGHGQITAASVDRSSGNASLDRAALRAARASTYAPPPSLETATYRLRYAFNW